MDKIVLFVGFALFLAANTSNGNMAFVYQVVTNPNYKGGKTIDEQRKMLMMGGQLIFVILLAIFASAGDSESSLALALLLGLALVWSMFNLPSLQKLVNNLQGK